MNEPIGKDGAENFESTRYDNTEKEEERERERERERQREKEKKKRESPEQSE